MQVKIVLAFLAACASVAAIPLGSNNALVAPNVAIKLRAAPTYEKMKREDDGDDDDDDDGGDSGGDGDDDGGDDDD